jgi:vacuolar-type H+-ATPase subunit F/Vma7
VRHLRIITRPTLVAGFRLAGMDAYSAEDVESARALIETWLDSQETVLVAIDDGLLERMDPRFVASLDSAKQLYYLAIPGGAALGFEASREQRIREMIRQAIGFQITFKGQESEGA